MASNKKQYYTKGVDNQKRADITFEIKRVDMKKLKSLSEEDKNGIKEFLTDCKKDIDNLFGFINEK